MERDIKWEQKIGQLNDISYVFKDWVINKEIDYDNKFIWRARRADGTLTSITGCCPNCVKMKVEARVFRKCLATGWEVK